MVAYSNIGSTFIMESVKRITKKHSFGSICAFIICWVLCASFIVAFFLPWISYTGTLNAKITGLDFVFNLIPALKTPVRFQNLTDYLKSLTSAVKGGNAYFIGYRVLVVVVPILYTVAIIWVLYFFFTGLVYLFSGRTASRNTPVGMAFTHFLLTVLISGSAIALGIIVNLMEKASGSTITKFDYLYAIIFMSVSFVGFVILAIIKHTTYGRNRVWCEDAAYEQYLTNNVARSVIGAVAPMTANNMPSSVNINVNKGGEDGEKYVVLKGQKNKIYYAQATGLPANISSIGGHAFAENMSLVTAVIPEGIRDLGPGAFANCGALRIVSIPKSVQSIGQNCFFNCASIQRINYAGTKEQWRHIARGSNWLTKAGTNVVICVDGSIIVNPAH